MGQHKYNEKHLLAKQGKINPKPKGVSKKMMQKILYSEIERKVCGFIYKEIDRIKEKRY